MGQDIQKGTIYAEGGVGGAGTVNAANLNAHVDESRIKASFISSKTLKDPASLSDSLVVESSGVLYRQTHQQIYDLVSEVFRTLLPIGTVVDFSGSSAPSGWLLCGGQAVSRTTYDELFTIIGVSYGSGDGVTTFNVPDLRGRLIAGRDDMAGTAAGRLTGTTITGGGTGLGQSGGVETQVISLAQMPSHNHTATASTTTLAPMHTTASEGGGSQGLQGGGSFSGRVWVNALYETGCQSTTSVSVAGAGAGAGLNNVQPTFILNKIIRAQS